MARTRLLDVRRRKWRSGWPWRAMCIDIQSQFRGPARAGCNDASGKPRRGGGERHRGENRHACSGACRIKAFTVCEGIAAPLLRYNIDTDMIVRVERIAQLQRGQFKEWA